MANSDCRRQLLLCLKSVEQRIISAEQAAPLLESWLEQPTARLVDLLIQHGLLTAEQLTQLEPGAGELATHSVDETEGKWATQHPRQDGTQHDWPNRPDDFPASVENTGGQTSARPATIITGQNEERFSIVSAYAEGGLGEISVAHDTQLGRMVALKQIKARWADDMDARSRFLQEAQITGRLEHPGIVPIYALGFDASGRPYYAMRFIEGETLQNVIQRFHNKFGGERADRRARLLDLRKLLSSVIAVCNTIDYAHNRGVIHRDLKPANILLGKYGETLVVDWGLAKVISGDRLPPLPFPQIAGSGGVAATLLGTALGTPAYMSPEQAAGKMDELGPKTDIYSLGVILYQVLTGRLPYEEESVSGVLERLKARAAPSLRNHAPWIPRPLEGICQKAMAPRPSDRYSSTAALATDIERWLAGEAIAAYYPPLWERIAQWWRPRE